MNECVVRQMQVRMCPECLSAFRAGDVCGMCGSEKPPEVFWRDESGDRLFQLISDVSEKEAA